MPVTKLDIAEFIELAAKHPVLDVRSEGEYLHAHIPQAINLPLFSDEQRKVVGTAYKQVSRQAAIKIGLDFFGPNMRSVVEKVEEICAKRRKEEPGNIVLLHCWRGGMRSGAIAWLLDLYGFKVYTLAGGYKKFRSFVAAQFEQPFNMRILGGYTGSAKTEVLEQLKQKGEAVIDLEEIANHKGSAFGAIGLGDQPRQEMFENLLAIEIYQRRNDTQNKPVWVEDESQRIGLVNIPPALWKQMRSAPVHFLEVPFEERLAYLVSTYGKLDTEKMISAVVRIRKRLGPVEAKLVIQFLLDNNHSDAFSILLKYYDKYYGKALLERDPAKINISRITTDTVRPGENADKLLEQVTLTRIETQSAE